MMLYYQTMFGCKHTSSLEDVAEIVIFWLNASRWPWPWRQWTTFSAWHSGSWCCITIPGLVTKYCAAQKILSEQTFTNILILRCDLVLERSNPFFPPQDTQAYGAVLSNQVGCKRTSSLEDIAEIVIFWLYKLSLWPWHWRQKTNFSTWHWPIMLHDHNKFELGGGGVAVDWAGKTDVWRAELLAISRAKYASD